MPGASAGRRNGRKFGRLFHNRTLGGGNGVLLNRPFSGDNGVLLHGEFSGGGNGVLLHGEFIGGSGRLLPHYGVLLAVGAVLLAGDAAAVTFSLHYPVFRRC